MFFRFSAVLALFFCAPILLAAETFSHQANFIQQRALGPIKQQSGLPEAASRLTTPSELQLSLVHNNVFMGGMTGSERLVLDGESSQLNVRYRRRLNRCWQLNMSGVVLAHSHGWFDKPLDDWHQFFNLPDAQRGDWPTNQLQYLYEKDNSQQVLTTGVSGLGDAQLQVQHNLGCSANAALVRLGVKLPIGQASRFLGNGGIDAFVDFQSPWQRSDRFTRVQWAGSVGLLGVGKNEQLLEAEPFVVFGTAGLNIAMTQHSELLVQLDWHTQMFKSELRELAATGVQLSIGWRYQTRNHGAWEFSFSEDAAIDTVPDIAIRLAWVSRFGAVTR